MLASEPGVLHDIQVLYNQNSSQQNTKMFFGSAVALIVFIIICAIMNAVGVLKNALVLSYCAPATQM
jgi:hypothetical protein